MEESISKESEKKHRGSVGLGSQNLIFILIEAFLVLLPPQEEEDAAAADADAWEEGYARGRHHSFPTFINRSFLLLHQNR